LELTAGTDLGRRRIVREYTRHHRELLYAEAVSVIDASEHGQPTIDDVAREIATSRRQLQRVFEEVGGVSFREYVLRDRMARAARLLARGMPVREVARRAGYEHPSHFARAFRRHHGVTPSAYARGFR
jgi:AraC family transcriptional regulator of adaptative response / methylphosphotriester-DNA alkyltransferase methyltransferase